VVVKVGFSQGKTWVARLICYFTHTDISHSFFLVCEDTGDTVYEAVPGGFRRLPFKEYEQTNVIKSIVDMEWPHADVKRALDRMLGMRYALLTFFVLGSALILRRTARRPELLGRYGIDCVSSITRVMRQFGNDLLDPVSPSDLRDRLNAK
jgi:hypothetical protein